MPYGYRPLPIKERLNMVPAEQLVSCNDPGLPIKRHPEGEKPLHWAVHTLTLEDDNHEADEGQ